MSKSVKSRKSTFEGPVKTNNKGRLQRHENILLVQNMTLLLVLNHTLLLDTFERVRSVLDAFNLKNSICITARLNSPTLTSLTIPKPPAPMGRRTSMSLKLQVFKASCTFLVGSSLSTGTLVVLFASPSLPTRLLKAFRSFLGYKTFRQVNLFFYRRSFSSAVISPFQETSK